MIPFNKPTLVGRELDFIIDAVAAGQLAGDGKYTFKCQAILNDIVGCKSSLLTHSCTAALEMCALLAEIKPGDEIIMPSYTFVSTANAFCLRGGVPVFVDIRPDTLNLDEKLVEAAITSKTRAIVAVHYAGVACEMNFLKKLCKERNLLLVEDAAQALGSEYEGKKLGSFGDLSTLSFHETKNVIAGEGGALLINNDTFKDRAEIIREKGTNRASFQRGEKAKYTWQDLGSSFLPGELIAAFLYAQLMEIEKITQKKREIWYSYFNGLKGLEEKGYVQLPQIPSSCHHNGHLFYFLLNDEKTRIKLINFLKGNGIQSVFHYIPLHSSPAGIRYGKKSGSLVQTENISSRILRLPSWNGLNNKDIIVPEIFNFFSQ